MDDESLTVREHEAARLMAATHERARLDILERAVAQLARRPDATQVLSKFASGIGKATHEMIDAAMAKLRQEIAKAEANATTKVTSLELEFACALRRGPAIDPARIEELEKRIAMLEEKLADRDG